MDDPEVEARTHLRRQHGLLQDRIARLQEMVTAVEYMLEAQKVGLNLTPEEKFEVFGDFDPDAHTEEVEQRWGQHRRVPRVGPADRPVHQGGLAAHPGGDRRT